MQILAAFLIITCKLRIHVLYLICKNYKGLFFTLVDKSINNNVCMSFKCQRFFDVHMMHSDVMICSILPQAVLQVLSAVFVYTIEEVISVMSV